MGLFGWRLVVTIGDHGERIKKHLDDLEKYLPPDELIAFLEPYIHAAQGRIIQAEYEQGTYGTKVKRYEGERYD